MKTHSLLLAVAVAGSVTAQSVPLIPFAVAKRDHPSPVGVDFTDACSGQFRCSGYPDCALLASGKVWMHYMPRYTGAIEQLPGTAFQGDATALAARPRGNFTVAGLDRARDELLIAHEGGVSRWWFNGTSHIDTLCSGFLASARCLGVADVDGDGSLDVFGLAADGLSVCVQLMQGDTPGAVRTIATNAVAYAVEAVVLPGSPIRRLVAASKNGLELVPASLTGSTTLDDTTDIGTAYTGYLTRVRLKPNSANGSEVLAWIRSDENGHDILRPYPGAHSDLDLGMLGVVGCAAGDLDGDGDQDLLLSQQVNHCVSVLFNRDIQLPLFKFSTDAMMVPLMANGENLPAPYNHARPVFTDLDGDGDADLLVAVRGTSTADPNRLCRIDAPYADGGAQIVVPVSGHRHQKGNLEILRIPVNPGGATGFQFTHCEVLTWDLALVAGEITTSADGRSAAVALLSSNMDVTLTTPVGLYAVAGQFMLWRPIRIEGQVVTKCGPAIGGWMVGDAFWDSAMEAPGAYYRGTSYPIYYDPQAIPQWPEEPGTDGVLPVGWVDIDPPPPSGSQGPTNPTTPPPP